MPKDPDPFPNLINQGFSGETLNERIEAWQALGKPLGEKLLETVKVDPAFAHAMGDLVAKIMEGVTINEEYVRERSVVPRIMSEIETRHPRDGSSWFTEVVGDASLPVGHRRVFALYYSRAKIDNGGFEAYFWSGLGCLAVPSIEAYEKADQPQLARLMKIALKICVAGPANPDVVARINMPPDFWDTLAATNFRMPSGFLDDVDGEGKVFDDLYVDLPRLMDQLPTSPLLPDGESDGFVTWYYENFPEDFVFSQKP